MGSEAGFSSEGFANRTSEAMCKKARPLQATKKYFFVLHRNGLAFSDFKRAIGKLFDLKKRPPRPVENRNRPLAS
jgi:hypothetical protein